MAAFAQSVIINTGTAGTPAYNAGPIYRSSASSAYDASRYCYLYTQSELAAAGITPGTFITNLGWVKNNSANALGGAVFRIYMKNSSATDFSLGTETWANLNAGTTLVYENLSFTVPATATPTYIDFTLNSPFVYTGGSLEISTEWDINGVAGNPSTGTFDWLWSTVPNRIYGTGNTTLAGCNTLSSTTNSISTIDDRRPFIKITYAPGINLNAGLANITAGTALCPGTYPVSVTLNNQGINDIDTVAVAWSVNGVSQPAYTYIGNLIQGASASLPLGTFTFAAGISYSLEAYITDVNGLGIDSSQVNDTARLNNVNTGLAGSYTINSAAATSGTNFQSFSALASALNTNGVCGAVVVDVLAGSGPYTEQAIFNQFNGSSPLNTVTINGNGELLQFAPTAAAKYVLYMNGTDYLIIDSLHIRGTDATNGFGVLLSNDAQYDTIRDCVIDLSAITSTTAANSAGIAASASITSPTTAGVTASNCAFTNNKILGSSSGGPYHGISLYGNTGAVGCASNLVSGNIITDFQNTGIRASLTSATVIDRNEVSRPSITLGTTVEAIYLLGVSNPKSTVSNNRVHNTHGGNNANTGTVYGLDISSDGGGVNQAINVFNNAVYNINGSGTAYGLYSSGVLYGNYYHNSISLDNTSAIGSATNSRGIYVLGTTDSINIYNNVVSVTRGGTGAMYGLYYTTLPANLKSNNNCVYVNTTSAASYFGYNGTPQLTYGDWLATSGGRDSATKAVNPLFVNINTGNLQPASPSINNIGIDLLTLVPTDILGFARTSTPDPGAFEFTPQLDNAGLIAINTANCPGTSDVFVTVQNFGAAALNTVTVSAFVDGNPLSGNGVYTLNLPSGEDTVLNMGSYNYVSGNTYNIVSYTALPNGFADSDNSNDTATLIINLGLTGTYTINASAATSGTNFQSFTDAANALNNYGLCGPVVLNVVPGSGPYTNQQIELGILTGSSAVNTVTIKGNYEVFSFLSTNTNARSGIRLNGTDYITIDSLTVIATGDTSIEYGWGISLTNQADNNNIVNCRITVDSTTTSTNYAGIVMSSSATSATTAGNSGNYNIFRGNVIRGGYYGITGIGNSTSIHTVGNKLLNNDVQGFYYYGTYFYNQDSADISGNTFIQRDNGNTTSYGINLSYNNFGRVTKNIIVTSAATTNYGLYCTNCYGLPSGYIDWSNNMISCLGGTGTTYGIYPFNCYYLNVYHNSVNTTGGSATAGRAIYLNSSTTGSYGFVNVKNNIGVNTGPGYAVEISSGANTLGYVTSMDRNNWYASGAVLGRYNNVNSATIGAWISSSLKDTNSVSVNPAFISNVDLHASSNFLNDRGELGLNILTDIDNDVRCPGLGCAGATLRPDIGADEFLGAPITVDMGALSLDSPTIKNCYSASEPVSIRIKNYNTQSIDFGAEPVTVTVFVSGAVTDTLGPVIIASGTLDADSALSVSIDSAFDMSVSGAYTFFIQVQEANDANPLNDTVSVLVNFNVGENVNTYNEVCSGSSLELRVDGIQGPVQWQSFDGTNWQNETGANNDSVAYVVTPTNTQYYRALVCGSYPTTTDTVVAVTVTNPVAINDTICGEGVATLVANGQGEQNWYATATGGNILATTDTFNVTVSADTTFYVESGVQLLGGGSPLKITEIFVDDPDAMEIQNLSNQTINTAGWVVAISNNYSNINTINTILWQLPATLSPGQILTRQDASAQPNYWGSNMLWNPANGSTRGWAMIVDNTGQVRDFVIWDNWPAGALNTFAPVVNGFTISLGTEWQGAYHSTTGIGTQSLSRIGSTDNNDVSDFVIQPATIGQQNPGLNPVFSGGTCTSARIPVSVKVQPLPVVDLGADTTQCGGSITLDAGNSGSSYAWSTTEVSQTVSVSSTGTVSVTVTDANTCSASDNVSVTIGATPVVDLGNDVEQCGGAVSLDAGNPGATFSWSNGATSQSIAATTSNEYIVTVTNSANCSSSDTAVITINALPVVALGNDIVQCGGSVVLDAANSGSSFSWNSGESSQTITLLSSASSSVTVTDANNCSASDSIEVTINIVPVVDLGSDVSQCEGTVNLDAGNTGASYLWSNGETTQAITLSASELISVVVTDANNCTATDTVSIDINAYPVVNLGNDVVQCAGTVTLNAGNPGSTYAWSSGASTQSITVSSSGTYNVTATTADGCEKADTVAITINPLPVVTFSLADTICVSNTAITLTGGLPVGGIYTGSGVSAGQFTPSTSGVVAITYTYVDSNNCSNASTQNVLVDVCVGVDDISGGIDVAIYPNPSAGLLNIIIGHSISQFYRMTLLATDGREVWQGIADQSHNIINLDFLAKGIYTLHVSDTEHHVTKRIVIE